jgi:LysM repeat protein
MFKKVVQFFLITGLFIVSSRAQTITPEQYIDQYKDIAIREMKRMGVPAAITLAQGLLETENGNSVLVKKSNNHFGIKCKSNWTAEVVSHDDDAVGECFRYYKTAEESYRDHSNFLRGSDRYSFLFSLNPTDYKGWANGLKKAGYATNPKYPAILIKSIEQYNLQQYSIEGAGEVPVFESDKYKDDPVLLEKPQKAELQSSGNNQNEPATVFSTNIDNINYINGSKCIYAAKGISILAIATHHNINLQKLLDINELEEDGILEADQIIFLQKKSKTGGSDFVVVQQKTTLYDVAQQNGILLGALLEYNQLKEDGDVNAGAKLYLKPVAESDQAKGIQNNAATVKTILYQVQPKEGLYTIAKKNGVTVQQIKEWNNLTSNDLKVGQQLIVGKQ